MGRGKSSGFKTNKIQVRIIQETVQGPAFQISQWEETFPDTAEVPNSYPGSDNYLLESHVNPTKTLHFCLANK